MKVRSTVLVAKIYWTTAIKGTNDRPQRSLYLGSTVSSLIMAFSRTHLIVLIVLVVLAIVLTVPTAVDLWPIKIVFQDNTLLATITSILLVPYECV